MTILTGIAGEFLIQYVFFNWPGFSWHYPVFAVAAVAILIGIRKYEIDRIRLKNRMKIADLEIRKLKEIDQLKSRFFTNISHEFRTPLTLIRGPLEELMEDNHNHNQKNKESLKLIHSNVTRLLELINQIMDLAKIESGNYSLKVQKGDITEFLKGIVMSFSSLAERKKITLAFEEPEERELSKLAANFYFDPDIIEKILNNLLSNAFKFTPENGRVTVNTCTYRSGEDGGGVEIIIADTGPGIPAEKLPYIFERFYQAGSSPGYQQKGSGIGLTYVRELVKAHKGEIKVKSRRGKGTTFSLRFPLGQDHLDDFEDIQDSYRHEARNESSWKDSSLYTVTKPQSRTIPAPVSETGEKPVILIVEDHAEVIDYIESVLKDEYRVAKAPGADEGFDMVEKSIPDLIITDIMMPGKDGFEFTTMIKQNEKTAHIPVIMLTARADQSDRIKGLETGADDYLVKPFNAKELLARAGNIISSRHVLREKFIKKSRVTPGGITVSSQDTVFMEKVLLAVYKNMDNSAFAVEDLAKGVGMSRSRLHRKLKSVTGMPANHFIRSLRMDRAKELLEKDAGNISEIAYMVGYDDPGYFTKSFRSYFGKLPNEIKKH